MIDHGPMPWNWMIAYEFSYSSPAWSPPPVVLSLADLEQIALQHNPTMIQAAAQASGAQGR